MRIALVGAGGFVGSALLQALRDCDEHDITCVNRGNYADAESESYDVVINSAMPSGRFWAKNNPQGDFVETVEKTHRLITKWKWERFVQISSVSARAQLNTVYGRHKAAAEALCDLDRSLVVRLGPMFGPTLKKGVLIDMLNSRQVFVSGESRYAFSPLDWVASRIVSSLAETGLKEIGVNKAIKLIEVRDRIGSNSEFSGPVDIQEFGSEEVDAPDMETVFDFLSDRQAQLKNGSV